MLFIWITLFCSFICIRSLNFSFLILVKALSIISLNLVLSMYILYKYKIKNNLRIRNLCILFSSKKVLCISFLSNGFKEYYFFILSYVFSHKTHFVAISHCPTHVFIHLEPLKDFCFLEPIDSIMCVQNDQKLIIQSLFIYMWFD